MENNKLHMTTLTLRITHYVCLMIFVVAYIYYNFDKTDGNMKIFVVAKKPKKLSKTNESPNKVLHNEQYENHEPVQYRNYYTSIQKIYNEKICPLTDKPYPSVFKIAVQPENLVKGIENFDLLQELSKFLQDQYITVRHLNTFKTFLLKNMWMKKTTEYFGYPIKTKPRPLTHRQNTCFFVSLLHCIRSNKPLAKFLTLKNIKTPNFGTTLKRVLKQKIGFIVKSDFDILVNKMGYPKTYIFGNQEDPRFIINTFFNKCNDLWAYMNFSCLSFFHICAVGHINPVTEEEKLNVGNNYPLLEVLIAATVDSFDLQKLLNGIEITARCLQCVENNSKVYEFPLFTKAAPFLIFNFTSPTGNNIDHLIDINYQGFSMILQDKIRVPTVFDGVNEYEITGFTEFTRMGNSCGHYRAYIKYKKKWYRCDSGSVEEFPIEYPLIIEKQLTNIITQAFYKKIL